ncbi:MAG: SCP-2 sterol transfer family protein [Sulfuriferula sp.]|nr:SCP-2 sterol transfer family protein [Sulfuriferula sp.]
MENLFSEDWGARFSKKWNSSDEIVTQLAAADFDAVVAFGYLDAPNPSVFIHIQQGRITATTPYAHAPATTADWDLRAKPEQWLKWRGNGPGITGLGVAVASRQLQFVTGDYRRMIRQPLLAGPFLKFFAFL